MPVPLYQLPYSQLSVPPKTITQSFLQTWITTFNPLTLQQSVKIESCQYSRSNPKPREVARLCIRPGLAFLLIVEFWEGDSLFPVSKQLPALKPEVGSTWISLEGDVTETGHRLLTFPERVAFSKIDQPVFVLAVLLAPNIQTLNLQQT